MEALYLVGPVMILVSYLLPDRQSVYREYYASEDAIVDLPRPKLLYRNGRRARMPAIVHRDDHVQIVVTELFGKHGEGQRMFLLMGLVFSAMSILHYTLARRRANELYPDADPREDEVPAVQAWSHPQPAS